MPETSDTPMTRAHLGGIAQRVYALVRACPAGRVTTYGWLGAAVGYPKAARVVGWIMNNTPRGMELPAQRVINSKGELTGSWAFGQKGRMRQLLESEGIVFSEKGTVDLKRYGWQPLLDLTDDDRERIFAEAAATPVEPSEQLLHLVLDDPTSPFRIAPQKQITAFGCAAWSEGSRPSLPSSSLRQVPRQEQPGNPWALHAVCITGDRIENIVSAP